MYIHDNTQSRGRGRQTCMLEQSLPKRDTGDFSACISNTCVYIEELRVKELN